MTTLLEQAVIHIKAGEIEKGKQILVEYLRQNPKDENGWLWMSKCVTSPNQKRDCFNQVLKINPNNKYAKEGLQRLVDSQNIRAVNSNQIPKKNKLFPARSIIIIFGILVCAFITIAGIGLSISISDAPTPSPTNVPVVIDSLSLIGKSLDEMRSKYEVVDPFFELSANEPDKEYANIDFGEEYTDGKYRFTMYYDENYKVNQIDLKIPYYTAPDLSRFEPSYKMSEWQAVMQMLNLDINYPPDEIKGNQDIPFAYVWSNHNGFRVWINRTNNENIILYSKVIKLK